MSVNVLSIIRLGKLTQLQIICKIICALFRNSDMKGTTGLLKTGQNLYFGCTE